MRLTITLDFDVFKAHYDRRGIDLDESWDNYFASVRERVTEALGHQTKNIKLDVNEGNTLGADYEIEADTNSDEERTWFEENYYDDVVSVLENVIEDAEFIVDSDDDIRSTAKIKYVLGIGD